MKTMQSKLFPTAVIAALVMFANIATAQVTNVSGKVTLKQADGTVRRDLRLDQKSRRF